VPPCVWYRMTYLPIRNTIGSVSCSVGWGMASYFVTYFVNHLGMLVREILALQAGPFVQKTIAKHDILI
jgi:hypothetical protein